MQIPNDIDSFENPTLLVIADHTSARMYALHQRGMKDLGIVSTKDTEYNYSDKEGFSHVGNTQTQGEGTVPGMVEKNSSHYNRVFSSYLVKDILEKNEKHKDISQIIICLPDDMKSLVQKELPDSYAKMTHIIQANYASMPIQEILSAVAKKDI